VKVVAELSSRAITNMNRVIFLTRVMKRVEMGKEEETMNRIDLQLVD